MGVDKVGVDEMGRIRTGIKSSETVTPKSCIFMTRLKFERVCKCNNCLGSFENLLLAFVLFHFII